jgi:hypothetical protein
MYFLKCPKCGHFNEVKTEYMIFCANCHKKLDNNYTDWFRQNPDKSFDTYKQLMCSTEINEISKNKVKTSKPKQLKFWIGFAVTLAIFYAIGQFGGQKIIGFFHKPLYDEAMMAYASELNKSCPIMIDNATRLDNAIALPGNTFQYNYTLVNMVKDSIAIDELKKKVEPTIINFVKTNPEMKTIRDNKTIVNYYYKDKTGVYLFTVSVKPEQYR